MKMPHHASPALRWGGAAFLLYGGLSVALGERLPFSRYAMYADIDRSQGAIPVFLVDNQPVDYRDYTGFYGFEPSALLPKGISCSMEYLVHDAAAALRQHAGETPGPVPLVFGYRILALEAERGLQESLRVVQQGSAWPR